MPFVNKIKKYLDSEERENLVIRPFCYIPRYNIFFKSKNKHAKFMIKNNLNPYNLFSKKIILFIFTELLSRKENLQVPDGTDLVFFGNRIKLFNLSEKKVYTLSDNRSLQKEKYGREKARRKINWVPPCKIRKNIMVEDLIYSDRKFSITDKDTVEVYREMVRLYKPHFKKASMDTLIKSLQKRFNLKKERGKAASSNKSILTTFVHGDFWKGNLIKNKKGVYVLDWSSSGEGNILEDFVHYFWAEYHLTSNFNKKLFLEMKKLVLKEFNLSEEEFYNQLRAELFLTEFTRPKKQKRAFDIFSEKMKRLAI